MIIRRQSMFGRMVCIDLDAITDDEVTTEDEDMQTNPLSATELSDTKDLKIKPEIKVKNCCDDQKVETLNEEKSDNCVHPMAASEDLGEQKLKKLNETKFKNDVKKVLPNDLKSLKVFESCCALDDRPSTSKSEPKTDFFEQVYGESDSLSTNALQFKDQSTDSRYYCRELNSSVTKTSSMVSNTKPTAPTSTIAQKIWVYICGNCCERHKSKKDFENHFNKSHSNIPNVPKKFQKIEESILRDQTTVVPTNHSYHSFKNEKKCSKSKCKLRSKSPSAPNPISNLNGQPTHQFSAVFPNTTHYRLAQKCKICSFTPLFNSMEAIQDHIIREHNHKVDIAFYYSDVLVKVTPKKKT